MRYAGRPENPVHIRFRLHDLIRRNRYIDTGHEKRSFRHHLQINRRSVTESLVMLPPQQEHHGEFR